MMTMMMLLWLKHLKEVKCWMREMDSNCILKHLVQACASEQSIRFYSEWILRYIEGFCFYISLVGNLSKVNVNNSSPNCSSLATTSLSFSVILRSPLLKFKNLSSSPSPPLPPFSPALSSLSPEYKCLQFLISEQQWFVWRSQRFSPAVIMIVPVLNEMHGSKTAEI